jgi:hypothetical protein
MASVVNIHAMITKTVKQLRGSYKFVLAFGNSLCKEYTTEKLFYLFQEDFNIIPVIIVPSNSHISTSDFNSPKSLALYPRKVAATNTLNKYCV